MLDTPAWASLHGPHAGFAERVGRAVRHPVDVSPFLAMPTDTTDEDWADAAALVGPGGTVLVAGAAGPAPAGWEPPYRVAGNTGAIGLYESLGSRLRTTTTFAAVRAAGRSD